MKHVRKLLFALAFATGTTANAQTGAPPMATPSTLVIQPGTSDQYNLQLFFALPTDTRVTEAEASALPNPSPIKAPTSDTTLVGFLSGSGQVVYDRKIAQWTDPFTLPRTRQNGCAQWLKVLGAKICIVPRIETSVMQVELFIKVAVPDLVKPEQLQSTVESAISDANTAGIIAALVACYTTGCTGATATYIAAFQAALVARLQSVVANLSVNVQARTDTHWSDYR